MFVYFVDRVILMFLFKFLNGICFFNSNVDRLIFLVLMEIDKQGNVVKYDIFESVIRSKERMIYINVIKIFKEEDKDFLKRYEYIREDLELM